MMTDSPVMQKTLILLTADIVSAHIGNNSVAFGDLPSLISNVYNALAGLKQPRLTAKTTPEPAISIHLSIQNDYIICLEDGKKLKMLKRHLASSYNLTPEQYRARWNLPAGYPMVAPKYSEKRRELAKKIGLGKNLNVKPAAKRISKPAAKKS